MTFGLSIITKYFNSEMFPYPFMFFLSWSWFSSPLKQARSIVLGNVLHFRFTQLFHSSKWWWVFSSKNKQKWCCLLPCFLISVYPEVSTFDAKAYSHSWWLFFRKLLRSRRWHVLDIASHQEVDHVSCPTITAGQFDHLLKVVTSTFLHDKDTFPSSQQKEFSWVTTSNHTKYGNCSSIV